MNDYMVRLVNYDNKYFELSKKWLSDEEVNLLVNAGQLPSDEERTKWFLSLSTRKDYKIWGIEFSCQPIGVCGLKKIGNGQAEYWGYIGEKSLWGKGLGRSIIVAIIQEAKLLDIKKINLGVLKINVRAYKLYLKNGFEVYNETESHFYMSKSI